MREKRNVYRVLVGKSEDTTTVTYIENHIKMDLRGLSALDWTYLD
jgi:hypothetical protein